MARPLVGGGGDVLLHPEAGGAAAQVDRRPRVDRAVRAVAVEVVGLAAARVPHRAGQRRLHALVPRLLHVRPYRHRGERASPDRLQRRIAYSSCASISTIAEVWPLPTFGPISM